MIIRLNVCAVSVIALGAVCNPAFAADWNNGAGTLKDPAGRAAVAVPAPMPIPESYGTGWYLRGDIGIGRAKSDISESGQSYGVSGADFVMTPTSPFGSSPSWFNHNGKTLLNYGIGLGYHWSKNFRTDVTFDQRNRDQYTGRGTYTYDYQTVSTAADTRVAGKINDDSSLRTRMLLLNGYYDLGSRHGFTPYIGAGIGLARLTVSRDVSTSEATCDITAEATCVPTEYAAKSSGSNAVSAFSFAAMATAGVSYSLTRNTAIDVNYRYVHVNGTDISTTVNGQNSKVTIGNIGDHQLRAGLRWDIN
jgi:opacity protein-like surface antigen